MPDNLSVPCTCSLTECQDCFNTWYAVYELGTDNLECPKCASTNTLSVDEKETPRLPYRLDNR